MSRKAQAPAGVAVTVALQARAIVLSDPLLAAALND